MTHDLQTLVITTSFVISFWIGDKVPYLGPMGETIASSKCQVCGDDFAPRKGGKPQLYCSSKCRHVAKARSFRLANPEYDKKYRKPPIVFKDKPCQFCGTNFTPLRNNHVFCSESCSISSLAEKNRVLATCWECGARFAQKVKNQRYCLKCKMNQRSARSENNELKARLYKEVKNCKVCEEVFTAYRSTSMYCSKVCSGIARRKRVRESTTLAISQVSCEYCNKSFTQKNPNQRFCSRSCSQKVWHYTQRGQDKRFWTSYRLRYETVEEILQAQGNGCAICGVPFEDGSAGRSTVHVDHDHSCCPKVPTCGNCNRGLICGNCNTMLGMAKDNADVLEKAAIYLKNSRLPSPSDDRSSLARTSI
jgi:hypothetical protein